MDDISALVAAARQRAGLTQRELADRCGTSQAAIARLERAQVTPSLPTLRRVLGALGLELHLELRAPRQKGRDPVVDAYKRDVDRTLIRENLRKSVDRRLRDMEAARRSAVHLRAATVRARARP